MPGGQRRRAGRRGGWRRRGRRPAQGRPEQRAPGRQTQQGGRAGGRGGRAMRTASNWDAPYIISPHSPRRLYWASNYVYRSDDRGDTLDARSARTSRAISIATRSRSWARSGRPTRSRATRRPRALSNIVALDESPLLEGLIYVGHRRRAAAGDRGRREELAQDRQFPGVPQWTYVSDVFASPRDAEHGVRRAQQLAARRLQAVPREEHRSRPHVDEHHRRPAATATTCGRSIRIT